MVKSGDRQLGSVGTALKLPIVLRTVDRHGNAVPGAASAIEPAAGKLADSSDRHRFDRAAKILWTLGRPAGLQRMRSGSPGRRHRGDRGDRARAAGQAGEARVRGPPETAKPGKPLPKPLVVLVTDAYGNPLGGQTVVFKPHSGR